MAHFTYNQAGQFVPTHAAFASDDRGLTQAAYDELTEIKARAVQKNVYDDAGARLGTLYFSPVSKAHMGEGAASDILIFEADGYNDPAVAASARRQFDMAKIFAQATEGEDRIIPKDYRENISQVALINNGMAEITQVGSSVVLGSDPEERRTDGPRHITADASKNDTHLALGSAYDRVTVTGAPEARIAATYIHGFDGGDGKDALHFPEYPSTAERDPQTVLKHYNIVLEDAAPDQLEAQNLPGGGLKISSRTPE